MTHDDPNDGPNDDSEARFLVLFPSLNMSENPFGFFSACTVRVTNAGILPMPALIFE